ncbi:MAG TPA: arsinothricin resistance N-acetyltransferase ArsN1 family B [Mycobacteriales bacterium]|nr:arsinothricin resistance N-acetyltransferase ArsN1 family B [Mycobacteriales bacterium]
MIRPATASDAAAVAAVYAVYVLGSVATFEEVPPTADEVRGRLANGLPWLVAEEDGAVVGYAYAGPHHPRAGYRWSVTVSVYVDAEHHGRGLGKALYGELLPLLAELGYIRAFAGITLPNDASVGLHEALGFTPVGVYRSTGFKHGQWRDVGWWQRALQVPPPGSPPEPRRWDLRA